MKGKQTLEILLVPSATRSLLDSRTGKAPRTLSSSVSPSACQVLME